MTDLNYKRIQQFEEAERNLDTAIKEAGEALVDAFLDDLWFDVPLRLQNAAVKVLDARQALITLESR